MYSKHNKFMQYTTPDIVPRPCSRIQEKLPGCYSFRECLQDAISLQEYYPGACFFQGCGVLFSCSKDAEIG